MVLVGRGGKFPESLRLGTGGLGSTKLSTSGLGRLMKLTCPTFRR
jgi:hypothetical protein